MRANAGDALLVRGHHVGEHDREATVIEVRGANGEPPYVVRWDDGHESMFFPSSDTIIEHLPSRQRTE